MVRWRTDREKYLLDLFTSTGQSAAEKLHSILIPCAKINTGVKTRKPHSGKLNVSESLSDGMLNRKHRGKFPAQSLKNVISAPQTQSQSADGLQNQFYSYRNVRTQYTANIVQSPNRTSFTDFF